MGGLRNGLSILLYVFFPPIILLGLDVFNLEMFNFLHYPNYWTCLHFGVSKYQPFHVAILIQTIRRFYLYI